MSTGKSSTQTGSAPVVSASQLQNIANQAQLYKQAQQGLGSTLGSATDLYNQSAGGVNQAANTVAQTGNALAQNMGQGGANAYQTGVNALSNISSPEYQQQELSAAMIPAQQQYMQNLASQGAGFGGAGQLGSSREALAGQQLAGQNMLNQQQAAAQVLNNITNQQLQAGQGLTGAGISGGQLGLQGAQAGLGASQANMQYLQNLGNYYGQLMPGIQPNYTNTVGTQGTTAGQQTGITL